MKNFKVTSLRLFLIVFAICVLASMFNVGAVDHKGTATAFTSTTVGEYGKLIWKQDFDNALSIGDYYYDASYVSSYAKNGATLNNSSYVYTGDGDATNPTLTIVDDTVTGQGKALSVLGTTDYPIYRISFDGNVISKPGKYTFVYNGYYGGEGDIKSVCRIYTNNAYTATETGESYFSKNGYGTYAYSMNVISPTEFASNGGVDNTHNPNCAYNIPRIFMFQRLGNGKTVLFDNIELWYEEYPEITYHIDGPDDYVTNAASKVVTVTHKTVKPGTALPTITFSGSPYYFAGWSTSSDASTGYVTEVQAGMSDLYAVYKLKEGVEETVTVFDALIDMCVLHAQLNGKTSELGVNPVIDDCIAYASKYGIDKGLTSTSVYRALHKFELAQMLDIVLPDGSKTAINTVVDISDVKAYYDFSESVFTLYRAGIFESGEFKPFNTITPTDYNAVMDRAKGLRDKLQFTMNTEYNKDPMIYTDIKRDSFDASFIVAPDSYLATLEAEPNSTLNMGKWVSTWVTRQLVKYDFTPTKTIAKAELEFQSDNPFDFFVNGNVLSESENDDGWHLTGVVDITHFMTQGKNHFSLRGFTSDDPLRSVSALRGGIKITYTDGTTEEILTGGTWRFFNNNNWWSGVEPDGWITADVPQNYSYMIEMPLHPRELRHSLYFRKDFVTGTGIKKATLYTTGKGEYVPYLNGVRVTNGRFLSGYMPAFTEYQIFDVTDMLSSNSDNVIASYTGNGRYNSTSWGSLRYNKNAILMQLEIEYEDGTTQKILTDNTWCVTASPLIDNDIQFGERYDARLEIEGWNAVGTPSGSWVNAIEFTPSDLKPYASQTYAPVKIRNEHTAVNIGNTNDGQVLYDFGTNSSGRAKITLKNTKPGEVVIIRYCEVIDPNTNTPAIGLYSDVFFPDDNKQDGRSPYGARNIDVYICKGADEEIYMPEFAYTGFRYVYISGYTGEYGYDTVRKVEMNTELREIGDITTSNSEISMIWDAVKRSYLSNSFSGPTDCPTREKNFWNGDIADFVATACWYTDSNSYLARWTEAGYKAMGLNIYGWEDEEYILPLTLYKYYGNREILEIKYPTIKALIQRREEEDMSKDGLPSGTYSKGYSPYNDHSSVQNVPADFFSAAYFCRMYRDCAEIAEILGYTEDAAQYSAKFEVARQAFNTKYYVPEEKTYTPRVQGAIIIPVAFGIPTDDMKQGLIDTLNSYVVQKDYHLTCGFSSMEYSLGLLCDGGYVDTAWKTITNPTGPSMVNMLTNHTGGTTTEAWDGYTGGDTYASMNHYAIGAISRWFFDYLGGLTPTSAGFATFDACPTFIAEMGDVNVTYDSVNGFIRSEWVYNKEENNFTWTLTVPEGTTATASAPQGFAFIEDGKANTAAKTLTGGTYTYTVADYEPKKVPSNIVCIGDSLTQGDYGSNPPGTMNVKDENYPFFLAEITGADVFNAGACGRSASLYWSEIQNRVALSENTEMILIMLGTNGYLTDTIDEDTMSDNYNDYANTETGSYAKIIEYCMEKTGNKAKIILMTPPVTTARDKAQMETTVEVIKKFGKKYGLDVIDNYNNCGITYDNISTYMPVDGLHCGLDGYKVLAQYIAGQALKYYRGAGEYALDYKVLLDEKVGYMGRWSDVTINGVTAKNTIGAGAEFYFEVTDTTSVALELASINDKAPYIALSIDGSEPVRMETPLTGTFTIAENLSTDRHEFRIIVDSIYEYEYQKWLPSANKGFTLKDVIVDDGAIIRGLYPVNKTIMYFGDSITEGVAIFAPVSSPEANSAMYEYPFVTSHALGAVSHTNGFGGSGITREGSGGIPKCLTVIDYVKDGVLLSAQEPDMIVVNHGHNDLGPNSTLIPETFKSEYAAVLNRLREKYPNATIFAVVPYVQRYPDIIKECVDEMGDDNVYYIATAGWKYTTSDSAHPDAAGARALGLKLAEEISKIMEERENANNDTIDITLDVVGNKEVAKLVPGSTLTKTINLAGHTFLGWSLTEGGNEFVTKVPEAPATLYAVFQKNTVSVPSALGDYPYYKDGLGKVVVYADGSSLEAYTYTDSGITINSSDKIRVLNTTAQFVENPDGQGTVTHLKAEKSEMYKPTYGTFTLKNGLYYMTADYYIPTASNVTNTSSLGRLQFVLGTHYEPSNGIFTPEYFNANKDKWVTYVSSPVIANAESVTYAGNALSEAEFNYRWLYANDMSIDVDNAQAGLYVKDYTVYYYPQNSFMLSDSTLQLIETASTSIVLPKPSDGKDSWIDSDGKVYNAGQSVNIADVEHKTLYSYDTTPVITVGDESSATITTTFTFSKEINGVLVAATYSEDGKLLESAVLNNAQSKNGVVKVKTRENTVVKVFAFSDLSTLKPLGEAQIVTE